MSELADLPPIETLSYKRMRGTVQMTTKLSKVKVKVGISGFFREFFEFTELMFEAINNPF